MMRETVYYLQSVYPKRRMSVNSLRYVIKRISNKAGIKKQPTHTNYVIVMQRIWLIMAFVPLEITQSILGHQKSETTRIYTHLIGKLRHDF